MKRFITLTNAALLALLISCTGSLKTFSDYNKTVDYNQYKTYAWLPPQSSNNLNIEQIQGMYSKLIISASAEDFKKKGMVLDEKNPDVLFRFAMGREPQVKYSESPVLSVGVGVAAPGYYGVPGYYGGVAVPIAGGEVTETTEDLATLYIQMFETKSGGLLWTGGANKVVDNSANTEKNMRLALNAIYAKLPIRHR
jgi:hypothetical protein